MGTVLKVDTRYTTESDAGVGKKQRRAYCTGTKLSIIMQTKERNLSNRAADNELIDI